MFYATSPEWTADCDALVGDFLLRFEPQGLRPDNFALVALQEQGQGTAPLGYAHRGDWRCYPCSLVKSFHLVHVLHAIDQGRVHDHPELSRAMRDMILWSSNTGTNYVIDVLTETTGDTLLEGAEFEAWRAKRERLNGFFLDLGWPEFAGCNITQKLMDDRRYGREAQYAGPTSDYLNALIPLAPARLMHEIFAGDLPLSEAARARAQAILERDRESAEAKMPHFQVDTYLGGGVPAEGRIWSKAGKNSWTGDPRASYFKHDSIRIAMPGKKPVIISLMTQGKGLCEDHPEVFPQMGAMIVERLMA